MGLHLPYFQCVGDGGGGGGVGGGGDGESEITRVSETQHTLTPPATSPLFLPPTRELLWPSFHPQTPPKLIQKLCKDLLTAHTAASPLQGKGQLLGEAFSE